MSKKPAVVTNLEEERVEEIKPHWTEDPNREFAHKHANSLAIIGSILEETILQKGAEHLYNAYLMPKILPYTALQTIQLTQC